MHENIRVRLRGRRIPKLARELVKQQNIKMGAGGGDDMLAIDASGMEMIKRHNERSRLKEKTEFDYFYE